MLGHVTPAARTHRASRARAQGTLFSRFGITDGLKGISEKGAEVPITKSGDASMQAWQGQPTSGITMMMPMQSMPVRMPGLDAYLRLCRARGALDSRALTLPTLC